MNRAAFIRRIGAVVLAANLGLRPWRLEEGEEPYGKSLLEMFEDGTYVAWIDASSPTNPARVPLAADDYVVMADSETTPTLRYLPYD